MLFKEISYLQLWLPLCSAEQNHLCNFGRGLMRNNGSGGDVVLKQEGPWALGRSPEND